MIPKMGPQNLTTAFYDLFHQKLCYSDKLSPTAYQLKIGKEVKSMHTRSKVTFNVEGAFVRNFMK